MPREPDDGFVLDAGAFIALERGDGVMSTLVSAFLRQRTPLVTSAGVVAQIWRGGSGKQHPVAFLLRRTEISALDAPVARTLGKMLGSTRTYDAIDAHVVLLAQQRDWPVLTSDPDDLLAIDPALTVERV